MRLLQNRAMAVVAASVMTATAVGAAPALAKGGDRMVTKSGPCSGNSIRTLKLDIDDGFIDFEFEVDQNVARQRWDVVLRKNGKVFFRGVRRTREPSGSFTVDRRTGNPAGRDAIFAKARNARTDEVCRVRGVI